MNNGRNGFGGALDRSPNVYSHVRIAVVHSKQSNVTVINNALFSRPRRGAVTFGATHPPSI